MAQDFNDLLVRARQIRDETQEEANSAVRVGQFLEDLLEFAQETGGGVLTQQIIVSLGGGKTAGAIVNGNVLAAGTTFESVIRRMLVEKIYPTSR